MRYQPVRRVRPLAALGVACCVAFLMSARGADDVKPAASDDVKPAALGGKWVYEAQTIGGWDLPQARRDEIWIEIEGSSFFRCGKGGLRQESELTLDPARQPKEFVLRFKHPVSSKVSESKGIYRLEGDRLTLCYDNSGKTRPSKFESPEGREEIVLSVLKRNKK
jgi:uncharacterized protein (TIGR03067 family)